MNQKVSRILIRQSETRERLNALAALEEPTDGQTAELKTLRETATAVEKELREALAEEPAAEVTVETTEVTAEERERRELRSKASLHRYIGAALRGKDVDGAESELAAAHGCPDLVPFAMFEPTREERERQREERVITPAPSTTDDSMATILPGIFAGSVADFLGIEMPTVGTGTASYPVLSTSVTASALAKDADAPKTAGAFTVTTLSPIRVSGQFEFRMEDAAVLVGMESSLRENLGMVMRDALNDLTLNGNAATPAVSGIIDQLGTIANSGTRETFASYVTRTYAHVDGKFATRGSAIRQMTNAETYRDAAGIFATNTDTSALSYIDRETGGMRTSSRMPATPSSGTHDKNALAIVRRSIPGRFAVQPAWQGVELIRDRYSSAGKGQTIITAHALVGPVAILRSGAFVGDRYQVKA